MTTAAYIKIGQFTALVSFLSGTAIFVQYYLTSGVELLFIGVGFIVLITILNIGILIAIKNKARKDLSNRQRLQKTSGLMLINIPIMILYCWMVMFLMGSMRINFINNTNTTLSDINIVGCGGAHIDHLEVGESKTVWIDISGDCSISINYLEKGERKTEAVAGYVTSGMGKKVSHKINGKDKEIFL